MNAIRRSLYLPVEDNSGVIDEFRKRFDPLNDRPSRIVLVFPFSNVVDTKRISEMIALVCKNRLCFSLKSGPAILQKDQVLLPVHSQLKWFFEVHQKLSQKCGTGPDTSFSPNVILGRGNSVDLASEIEKIPKTLHLRVSRLVLEESVEDGISNVLFEDEFRPLHDKKSAQSFL